jgi:ABC-2 type transport system ATP-binding protein
METLVKARGLTKRYGASQVLDGIDLDIERGKIVGLIGQNGAGKTTALKCMLGLSPYEGELEVLGMKPKRDRAKLMQHVCFIADTAILPRWLGVGQSLRFMENVHPKFNRVKAEKFLEKTNISTKQSIGKLSKGMITQLHLALVMAIDVPLLVLDEPTLGLDILYRKQFYNSLLDDYFDENRTILITTHQVEEVETLLTDLVFIKQGKIILNILMEDIPNRFIELQVKNDIADRARALNPISEYVGIGKTQFIFEGGDREAISALGETKIPSISDLFVAKM